MTAHSMKPKPKAELMARLRAQRRAMGLRQINVLAYEADAKAIQDFAARLLKVRELYKAPR